MGAMTDIWPPVYDESYLPKPEQKYWFPEFEKMRPEERNRLILKRLRAQMAYAYNHSVFYHELWKREGLHPHMVEKLDDLDRFPFVTKQLIRQDQERQPPFDSNLCTSPEEVFAVHGTSGTTGRPTVYGISRGDWARIQNAHARVMWGFGLRPSDRVMIASIFSLYIGSWGALAGVQRLRAQAFPFGAGAPGQTRLAVMWAGIVKPTAFYSTPSYALYLAEVAKEEGYDPQNFGLRIMFFSGEPGAGLPSFKKRIRDTFGAICIDTGSTGEMTPWMSNGECDAMRGMHLWQDIVYTVLVDPKSGEVVDYGEEGVPVYTHLERDSQPMIRFFSGDLAKWTNEPCPCGRTYPRLPRGIYGRVDDMLIIRGENVFPSAIQEALERCEGYGGEFRAVITRERHMDVLTVQAEYSEEIAKRVHNDIGVPERIREAMQRSIKLQCGVTAIVQPMPPNTFERTQLKAKRIIDNRELYEELKRLRSSQSIYITKGGSKI